MADLSSRSKLQKMEVRKQHVQDSQILSSGVAHPVDTFRILPPPMILSLQLHTTKTVTFPLHCYTGTLDKRLVSAGCNSFS